MIAYADLLGSQIYEIQEVWMGQEDLQYANSALKTLPKGLWFFRPASPKEFPKVMGLTGVHNPNALHCFARVTFCPWCRKEEQNEGTIVNPLWTMHYKLGLVCKKCLCYPSLTSRGYPASWPKLQTAQGKQCQRGRWGSQCHIPFRLTNLSHPLQPHTICTDGNNMSASRQITLQNTHTLP